MLSTSGISTLSTCSKKCWIKSTVLLGPWSSSIDVVTRIEEKSSRLFQVAMMCLAFLHPQHLIMKIMYDEFLAKNYCNRLELSGSHS